MKKIPGTYPTAVMGKMHLPNVGLKPPMPSFDVYRRDKACGGECVIHIDTTGIECNNNGPRLTVYLNDDLDKPLYDNRDVSYTMAIKETTSKLNPHPHLHLIRRATILAENHTDVGKLFQWRNPQEGIVGWLNCSDDFPRFFIDREYREKPRTIMIGDVEVPEPLRIKPQNRDKVWLPNCFTTNQDRKGAIWLLWGNSTNDYPRFQAGWLHDNEKAAEIHDDAIRKLTETKS